MVLISGKADSFIAGADIEMLKGAKTANDAEALSREGHATVGRIASSKKPFVAAVHGRRWGGASRWRSPVTRGCSPTTRRRCSAFPEVQLAILPGISGLQRLAQKARAAGGARLRAHRQEHAGAEGEAAGRGRRCGRAPYSRGGRHRARRCARGGASAQTAHQEAAAGREAHPPGARREPGGARVHVQDRPPR